MGTEVKRRFVVCLLLRPSHVSQDRGRAMLRHLSSHPLRVSQGHCRAMATPSSPVGTKGGAHPAPYAASNRCQSPLPSSIKGLNGAMQSPAADRGGPPAAPGHSCACACTLTRRRSVAPHSSQPLRHEAELLQLRVQAGAVQRAAAAARAAARRLAERALQQRRLLNLGHREVDRDRRAAQAVRAVLHHTLDRGLGLKRHKPKAPVLHLVVL
mmetsp:Transcript_40145/g.119631  ORF Transcript_40145/g.119631 Transcript_40145/m.119631 type:complete len:212 (-) Transcript_40145:1837-2472(-)